MNPLLEKSFEKLGYNADFLRDINQPKYHKHVFLDENGLILSLRRLHQERAHIVILPDFDMDGISAGCIFYAGLDLLGFQVDLYAPDPKNGYGFTRRDIDRIYEEYPDCRAILTCDVGITCNKALAYAKQKYGCLVLVTDHHQEDPDDPIIADFAVDPSRLQDPSEFKGVCGAYMAWHVVNLYAQMVGNQAIIALVKHLLLFVSLGSVGDLMPLWHDTREAVREGLREFNTLVDADSLEEYFGCSLSLLPSIYFRVFANIRDFHYYLRDNRLISDPEITTTTYGFTYCPMFNSFKRMGEDLGFLYVVLYGNLGTSCGDKRLSIRETRPEFHDNICSYITGLNQMRKDLVEQYYQKLVHDKKQVFAPNIYITDAPAGLLGLLAMKLMQHNDMEPCIVLYSDGCYCNGSGRVPEFIPPEDFRPEYVKLSGHSHAFGIQLALGKLPEYKDLLHDCYERSLAQAAGADRDERGLIHMIGTCNLAVSINHCVDSDFDVSRVEDYDTCVDYTYAVHEYEPFGRGFERPEFDLYFRKSDVKNYFKMGKTQAHLKIVLDHNIYAVFFNGASYTDIIEQALDSDVLGFSGTFEMNHFNGSSMLQFRVTNVLC